MIELINKFCHHNRDVRPPSSSPPPPLLIMILMNFIILLMQTIIKIRHHNRDLTVPIVVAKIPIWLVARVQVEEIVFMAVRNFKASLLPPPAPTGGCCSPLCIIVSYCQMMAMPPTTQGGHPLPGGGGLCARWAVLNFPAGINQGLESLPPPTASALLQPPLVKTIPAVTAMGRVWERCEERR